MTCFDFFNILILNTIFLLKGVTAGLKRVFFRNLRKIPVVKRKIDEEIGKTDLALQKDINDLFRVKNSDSDVDIHYITKLPCNGLTDEDILQKLTEYMDLGKQYSQTKKIHEMADLKNYTQ